QIPQQAAAADFGRAHTARPRAQATAKLSIALPLLFVLAVIGLGAMLALVVFVQNVLGRRGGVAVNKAGQGRHLGDLIKHNGMVNSLGRILPQVKGPWLWHRHPGTATGSRLRPRKVSIIILP